MEPGPGVGGPGPGVIPPVGGGMGMGMGMGGMMADGAVMHAGFNGGGGPCMPGCGGGGYAGGMVGLAAPRKSPSSAKTAFKSVGTSAGPACSTRRRS